jgi:hypothetical protein
MDEGEYEYRNFTRYFATVPSGMHPLGCGGHQPPPAGPAACQRLAGDGQPARLGLLG